MQSTHSKTQLSTGLLQIYTGNGKGKTSAALGLAIRAAGHGLRTYMAQFMKGQSYGELIIAEQIPEITIEQFGKDTFVHVDRATEDDIRLAEAGLLAATRALNSGKFDIIILDEINVALYFKLIPLDRVIKLVQSRPKNIELVLTGRYAPAQLVEIADLVTEMVEVKHYFHQGILARDGIER